MRKKSNLLAFSMLVSCGIAAWLIVTCSVKDPPIETNRYGLIPNDKAWGEAIVVPSDDTVSLKDHPWSPEQIIIGITPVDAMGTPTSVSPSVYGITATVLRMYPWLKGAAVYGTDSITTIDFTDWTTGHEIVTHYKLAFPLTNRMIEKMINTNQRIIITCTLVDWEDIQPVDSLVPFQIPSDSTISEPGENELKHVI